MIETLQNILHAEIPITQAIGIRVIQYEGLSLTLSAPLDNNLNHKCTAFGGSLYSVSVLSGWGLIYLYMQQHGLSGHIVIQDSNIRFLKPVTTELTATCAFESIKQGEKFIHAYRRKGLARVKLAAQIMNNNQLAVVFEGHYVIHKK